MRANLNRQYAGRLGRAMGLALTCGGILRGRAYARGGWGIVMAYVKLKSMAILLGGAARSKSSVTRLMGWRVHFWGYRALAHHFESKFIEQEYWFESVTPRPFIIDCGANVGLATLYFKTIYPDAEVVSFEAHPWTFGALERNVRENGLSGVQVYHRAIGAVDAAAVAFYAEPSDPGGGQASLLPEDGRSQVETVAQVRVSGFIARPVDLLKIDIEGSELDVLRELVDSGKLPFVREMIIEYHHHGRPDEDRFAELLGMLEAAGFGYFIALPSPRPYGRAVYQDIIVHAYAKTANAPS